MPRGAATALMIRCTLKVLSVGEREVAGSSKSCVREDETSNVH
jgi:hypothetical protein